MTTKASYQIAILGGGHIAKKHLSAIQQHPELKLIGIVDPAKPDLSELTGAPIYADCDSLMATSKPDIIAICTPSSCHPEQTILAAKSGAHVVCEKPMALSVSDAEHMIDVCKQQHVSLFVVKQTRFNPGIQAIKQKIEQGQFGQLYLATANVFWTRPQDYFSASPWRGTVQHDGGALLNQASHYVDLMSWLVSPIQQSHAFAGTLARDIETEDTLVANFKFASGALGSLNLTLLTYPHNLEGSITLLGEKGSVKIGGKGLNQLVEWNFSNTEQDQIEMTQINQKIQQIAGKEHQLFYADVIQSLQQQTRPCVDGEQGLMSIKTIIDCYRSANYGQFKQPENIS